MSGFQYILASNNLTFRFEFAIPDNNLVGWKTYINEEYGFEFEYPGDWKFGISTSNGYPYIKLIDPIGQQIPSLQPELDRGAAVFLSIDDAERYAVQPVTLESLKKMYLEQDVTTGGFYPSDPDAAQIVEKEINGILSGIRRKIRTKY